MKGQFLISHRRHRLRCAVAMVVVAALSLVHSGCFAEQTPTTFFGRNDVPRAQHFRWSDGGLPRTFDPAFAAAPPDTDVVKALFEGLTDYDPRTLSPVPGVATRWEQSEGGKVWTFYLREDARWSNGEPVTAVDFVRSWQRTVRIGELAPHTELMRNIEGAKSFRNDSVVTVPERASRRPMNEIRGAQRAPLRQPFGAEALGQHVLRVHLERPDMSFPSLVAHSVFRPVKLLQPDPNFRVEPNQIVSNGAFSLARSDPDRVMLARAEHYWGKGDVALEQVEFVEVKNAEGALASYRDGEVDAVTNAPFEPLAIKLLAPYHDFRRATYGAVTYYSFNTARQPFDDVRVREALAIAIDRERISADDLGGATEPANRFLPSPMTENDRPVVGKSEIVVRDPGRARQLLNEAGFPGGKGFPKIRLLINRNEQQRLVSNAVAEMWRTELGIETEILMKNWDEYEAMIKAGDYDVVRRGLVMQTTDELTNIRMIFPPEPTPSPSPAATVDRNSAGNQVVTQTPRPNPPPIETEQQALREMKAFPIYFASSYALVKPYVIGFDANVLDAPSLKSVRIDTGWQSPQTAKVWSR